MNSRAIIIYTLLAMALLAQPHVFQGHVGLVSSATAQSLTTFVVLLLAATTYVLHRSDVRREADRKHASDRKLMASFRYIGVVNRQLPLLAELTTELLRFPLGTRAGEKEAFEKILSTAVVSIAHTEWGSIRIVDRASGRTVTDYSFVRDGADSRRVLPGNRELLDREAGAMPEKQEGPTVLWGTDTAGSMQCFLVLPSIPHSSRTTSILQAIVDQAQLLHCYRSSSHAHARTVAA